MGDMEQIETSAADETPPAEVLGRPRRWVAPLLGALGLVVGGLLVWLLLRPPQESSAEVTFARDMIAHHSQAVEMALIVRERSTDPDLRLFALDIVLTQQAQIGQMQGWLATWGQTLTGAQPPMRGHGAMMGMASRADVNALGVLPPAEAEVKFLQLMINHHLGGVAMAQALLAGSPRAEVARLAEAIVQGQQGEVDYMRDLLAQRNAAPAAPAAPPEPMPGMDMGG
jgi:uncharacterized protein (DUF305 family)